ncbi:MAG: hypothetical protein M3Y91_04380 [Actinomycetota bacterium]|nr:hypothetical protein [Actinomycetota bacterium]
MAETDPKNPSRDSVGDDYSRGANPDPGGEVSTEGSAVPPYEGRGDAPSGPESDSTARAYGSKAAEHEPVQPGSDADQPDSAMAPDDVGESINRRGEDISAKDGKEAGRHEEGEDSSRETDRQVGSSDNRDQSAI